MNIIINKNASKIIGKKRERESDDDELNALKKRKLNLESNDNIDDRENVLRYYSADISFTKQQLLKTAAGKIATLLVPITASDNACPDKLVTLGNLWSNWKGIILLDLHSNLKVIDYIYHEILVDADTAWYEFIDGRHCVNVIDYHYELCKDGFVPIPKYYFQSDVERYYTNYQNRRKNKNQPQELNLHPKNITMPITTPNPPHHDLFLNDVHYGILNYVDTITTPNPPHHDPFFNDNQFEALTDNDITTPNPPHHDPFFNDNQFEPNSTTPSTPCSDAESMTEPNSTTTSILDAPEPNSTPSSTTIDILSDIQRNNFNQYAEIWDSSARYKHKKPFLNYYQKVFEKQALIKPGDLIEPVITKRMRRITSTIDFATDKRAGATAGGEIGTGDEPTNAQSLKSRKQELIDNEQNTNLLFRLLYYNGLIFNGLLDPEMSGYDPQMDLYMKLIVKVICIQYFYDKSHKLIPRNKTLTKEEITLIQQAKESNKAYYHSTCKHKSGETMFDCVIKNGCSWNPINPQKAIEGYLAMQKYTFTQFRIHQPIIIQMYCIINSLLSGISGKVLFGNLDFNHFRATILSVMPFDSFDSIGLYFKYFLLNSVTFGIHINNKFNNDKYWENLSKAILVNDAKILYQYCNESKSWVDKLTVTLCNDFVVGPIPRPNETSDKGWASLQKYTSFSTISDNLPIPNETSPPKFKFNDYVEIIGSLDRKIGRIVDRPQLIDGKQTFMYNVNVLNTNPDHRLFKPTKHHILCVPEHNLVTYDFNIDIKEDFNDSEDNQYKDGVPQFIFDERTLIPAQVQLNVISKICDNQNHPQFKMFIVLLTLKEYCCGDISNCPSHSHDMIKKAIHYIYDKYFIEKSTDALTVNGLYAIQQLLWHYNKQRVEETVNDKKNLLDAIIKIAELIDNRIYHLI